MGDLATAQSARGVEREEGAESLRDTAGGGVAAAKDAGRGTSWAHAVVWGTARVVAVDVEGRGMGAAGTWCRPRGQRSLCLVFGYGDPPVSLSSSSLAGFFL